MSTALAGQPRNDMDSECLRKLGRIMPIEPDANHMGMDAEDLRTYITASRSTWSVLDPMQLTERQERFCLLYVEHGNATEAYRQSYKAEGMKCKTINEAASRLLKNSKVAARIAAVRANAEHAVVERLAYTKEVAMAELDRAMQLAEAAGNAAPLMTAIRLKCELNRLIVKQEEVGKPGEFDHLSDQDVRARREALAAIVKASTIHA